VLSGAVHRLSPIFAALLMLLNGCGGADHRVLEEVVEKVYPVDANANVSIQNGGGAILVYGSDVNEVRVRSLKRAYNQERLNQIAVDISTKPGGVSIITKFPPQPKWAFSDRSGTVDHTIVLPATASISALDLNSGEVLLDSMRGPQLRARLNDGRIFARNCFGNLDLTMNRGTLTLAYDWWEQQKFSAHINVGQGNAWVFLPTEAAFRLIVSARHGKIANDFNNIPLPANSSTQEMKIDQIINGGGSATIQVRVDKGDIKIAEANP
jgi:putative adhesin